VRYAFVARERAHFPTYILCRVMQVSVSGFHDYRHRQSRPDPDAAVRAQLHEVHVQSRRTYGRPRLVKALRSRNPCIGHKRVARLMREEGLRGKAKGCFKPQTTDSRHARPVAENRLNRQFDVDNTVPAWVGDITYIPTREGWIYLATVINLRTRQVLGYSLSERMTDDLVKQALVNAWTVVPAQAGTLFHSDRGSQYAGHGFQQLLASLDMVSSMSRKGNCWDNAVAESFFATLKNEEAMGVYDTRQQARVAITSYIRGFYNPIRLHSALDGLSPDDYAERQKQAV